MKIALLLSFVLATASARACTTFDLVDNDHALLGHNEDWVYTTTRVWFVPAPPPDYGCVFVGFGDKWGQGGMNSAGLAYDWANLKKEQWERQPNMESVKGNPSELMLRTCATVDEGIVELPKTLGA